LATGVPLGFHTSLYRISKVPESATISSVTCSILSGIVFAQHRDERAKAIFQRGLSVRSAQTLAPDSARKDSPMLRTILLVVLLLALLGAAPVWPYSTNWGYYPAGGFGLLLVLVIVLFAASPRRLD
jgi:hypothetical protein